MHRKRMGRTGRHVQRAVRDSRTLAPEGAGPRVNWVGIRGDGGIPPQGASAETLTAAPTGASDATKPTLSSRAGSPSSWGAIQRMSRLPSVPASSALRAVTSMRTLRSVGPWFSSLASCVTIGGVSSAPQAAPPGRSSSVPANTTTGPCGVS